MKTIFGICKAYPFMGGTGMIGVFSSKKKADAAKKALEAAQHPDDRPEYDDWGLTSGIEYYITEMELDPKNLEDK